MSALYIKLNNGDLARISTFTGDQVTLTTLLDGKFAIMSFMKATNWDSMDKVEFFYGYGVGATVEAIPMDDLITLISESNYGDNVAIHLESETKKVFTLV